MKTVIPPPQAHTRLRKLGSQCHLKGNLLLESESNRKYWTAVGDALVFAASLFEGACNFSISEARAMVQNLKKSAKERDQTVPRFRGSVDGYQKALEILK